MMNVSAKLNYVRLYVNTLLTGAIYGCRKVLSVDLYGNPAGVLDAEHVSHATQQLADAKAKFAEKRKAELAAKKAQQNDQLVNQIQIRQLANQKPASKTKCG